MREPLPNWHVTVHGRGELRGGGVFLNAWPDGVWQARANGPRPHRPEADDLPSAQLAAEDAARAMVADMAAALGGSVTWATERVVHILRPGLKCAAWGIVDPYLCGAKHVPGGPTAGDSSVYYDAAPTALNLETCPECIAAFATEGGE